MIHSLAEGLNSSDRISPSIKPGAACKVGDVQKNKEHKQLIPKRIQTIVLLFMISAAQSFGK